MKQNGKYKCNHLPGEVLVAVKKYNDRQYTVESQETKTRYMVHIDMFHEPSLFLAHVANANCLLTEIK